MPLTLWTRVPVGLLIVTSLIAAQSGTTVAFEGLRNSNPGASFDHGYVAAWDLDFYLQNRHGLTLYAPDGHKMFEVSSFKLPGGIATDAPISVDVDSDGTSAYAYSVSNNRGAGFAILGEDGSQSRIVETQPYRPSQVCFAPDHSLWMFGDQWASNGSAAPDFKTFRHYSRDGKLLGSYLPRSALPAWEGAGLDQVVAPVIGGWRLRAIRDRIGAALSVGGSRYAWVELNLEGELIGQWTYSTAHGEGAMPVAFDSDGTLYGQRFIEHKPAVICVFGRSDGAWKPVPSFSTSRLLAADGLRLVVQDGDLLEWIASPQQGRMTVAIAHP